MLDDRHDVPANALRPAARVMRLRRMGASFPTRLSFLRTLLRRLSREGAQVSRPVWQMDAAGFGHAVYSVGLGGHTYSLVAVSTDLPPDQRTDRVIATAWDTAYVLYDGVPTEAEVARIVATAPRQEAARFTDRDLVLSRANKSVRLFSHVVEALKAGRQPDADLVRDTGYLMRTTAVYGNGKFGIADRSRIADRLGLDGPFMAEMLTVWLIRGFTHDLVEHVGGATLDIGLKRHLGIGNSTGLGMAPFLVSHPMLLNAWITARETALARVRAVEFLTSAQIEDLYRLTMRAAQHLAEWNVVDCIGQSRIDRMRQEWPQVAALMTPEVMAGAFPADRLMRVAETFSADTQECLAALLIEPFGELVDDLVDDMATDRRARLDPSMLGTDLAALIDQEWAWAICDYEAPAACHQFWYVSQSKAEPRLGLRHSEPGGELESPLDIARQVCRLAADIRADEKVADLLARCPEHRTAVRRVQALATAPYAEIRDNLIGEDCLPIDMLRCKLSFFGAAKFDPKSDRWTRITLCQGAPLADELDHADDWWLPTFAP
ncbi:hypothetical protein [Pseudooctadecabacter jejudonensis]|uniref:Uncharacterized protein n=1 Tax=Pseudooctadecabacter jejudonensis TaxID=1391910 RepID=A0A1Y5SLY2_9RHOB|nr:hypothetical protein [Pseudooctadecabacter jejudonensis]SLN43771.1 hypothetical protein PSJ8397_02255 [Pseudooctadecabacter jejudonensis]